MAISIKSKYPQLAKIGNITTKYGGQTRGEKYHKGVDIANKKGTPIPNFIKGKVIATKTGIPSGVNGFGNSVLIRTKNGDIQRFSHLDTVGVQNGQIVKKGEIIGTMGNSGNSYSPTNGPSDHLDYRILDAYFKYRDPMKVLKKNDRKKM